MRQFCTLFLCCFLIGTAAPAFAQFTTVINVPPSTVAVAIGPDTQLNLGDGGTLPSSFRIGYVFGENANLEVNIAGGVVERYVDVLYGARVNILGGAIGSTFEARHGAQVTLFGGDFLLNGAPISGLDSVGQTVALDLPADSLLTGTLADGTPIAFSPESGDELAAGVLRLKRTAIPPAGPSQLVASTDTLGHGIRGGQTLTVDAGGNVPNYYMAGPGSIIKVLPNGSVGGDVKLAGATLNVDGGNVSSYLSALRGSVVNLSQGTIGSFFRIGSGSTVNMTGGLLDYEPTVVGGQLNVSGGSVGDNFRVYKGRIQLSGGTVQDELPLFDNSELIMSGGVVGGGIYADASRVTMTGGAATYAVAGPGSQFEYSGGEVLNALSSLTGGQLTIVGGEFRINGEPVSGATAVGDLANVNVPEGAVISGTLASGVPFAFSSSDFSSRTYVSGQDSFANGTLRLRVAGLPAVGPANLTASSAGPLTGIRNGQTLTVDGPNFIGERFHAGHGSTINVIAGGAIGPNFEAAGANINITGGSIDIFFDVFSGATVNLSAGQIGYGMDVMNKGVVRITGGSVGDAAYVLAGGKIELSAGSIGEGLSVHQGGLVSMTGGAIGKGLNVFPGGTIEIDGGSIDKQFDVQGLANVRGGMVKEATVRSGGVMNLDGGRVTTGVVVGASSALNVRGGTIDGDIRAENESTVAFTGGELKGRFSAAASRITISGGKLGSTFDSSPGATVQVSGGSMGSRFAPRGPLTILGANFEVNGVPVQGLNAVGDQTSPVIAVSGSQLTGTLADGTPFALSGYEGDDLTHPITLRLAALPTAHPVVLTASSDPLPLGIRGGQTLIVDAGSLVTRDFSAGRGSVVNVLPGGQVESNLEAAGAIVNIEGGSVGDFFGAFAGTVINMSSGAIGAGLQAHRGSVVNISGGVLGRDGAPFDQNFYAQSGSTVNISGGEINGLYAYEETRLTISGGEIERNLLILPNVDARISGGRFKEVVTTYYNAAAKLSGGEFDSAFQLYAGGLLELFVTDAKLANNTLELPIGQPLTVAARDLELSGRFAERQAFDFNLRSTETYSPTLDYFAPNATLTITRVFSPGDYDGSGVVDDADHAVWLSAMTTGNLAADGNYDRQVTQADLQVWQERYGTDYGAVPEGSTRYLAIVGMAVLVVRRRRYSSPSPALRGN